MQFHRCLPAWGRSRRLRGAVCLHPVARGGDRPHRPPYGSATASDHNVLYWSTNVVTSEVATTETLRDFNKADISSIKKELKCIDWGFDSDAKVNDLWLTFCNKMEDLITKHVQVRKLKTGKRKKALWMTNKAV